MVQGYGRNCAALLGLIGDTVDTGHAGPDLLDLIEPEPSDECDGWGRPADRPTKRAGRQASTTVGR
ncbi:hypothetical protein [Actinoplanes sp. NPDC051851]|uniref:hypothetical protein n=1 Tax=Actinoplanes sp. NPDC051851 TaxID=3154753 RepID=UPI00344AB8DA